MCNLKLYADHATGIFQDLQIVLPWPFFIPNVEL